ncbi:hypothetical protein [Mucilaginibacter sp. HD30]
MQKKLEFNVIICALARDCATALERNIPKIEQLRSRFLSSSVIVIENDSKDLTKHILKHWSETENDVTVISNDFNSPTIPNASQENPFPQTSLERISKMASYRNMYLEWIKQSDKKVDLVIVIDVDIKGFSVDAIISSITTAPLNWGGIFANGYTDTRIFKTPIYTMYHDMYAYAEHIPAKKPYFTYNAAFALKKTMNQKLKAAKFVPVISAFGGIGIYKWAAISGNHYEALENGDIYMEAVCEHITFNDKIRQRGFRAYISSELKVYYGKSNLLIVIRNILPLSVFKFLCLIVKFKKLKA